MTTYYLRHLASGTFVNACDSDRGMPSTAQMDEPNAYEWVPESKLTIVQMRQYEAEVYPGGDPR